MAEKMRLESEANNIRQNALLPEPQQSSWSPSWQWRSSFAAGSGLRGNAAPNIIIPSSCQQSLLPSSRDPPFPGPSVPSGLRPQARTFQPSKQPSGSTLHQAGQAFPGPICLPQESCSPNFPILSSLPSPQDYGMGQQGYPGYPGYPIHQIDFRGQEAVQ